MAECGDSRGALDGEIARALSEDMESLARRIIADHDARYADSDLRLLPMDERLPWLVDGLAHFVRFVETGEGDAGRRSYWPGMVNGFDGASEPYLDAANAYASVADIERGALPSVWHAFEARPEMLRDAVVRLHELATEYARDVAADLLGGACREPREGTREAYERGYCDAVSRAADALGETMRAMGTRLDDVAAAAGPGGMSPVISDVVEIRLMLADLTRRVGSMATGASHANSGAPMAEAPAARPVPTDCASADGSAPTSSFVAAVGPRLADGHALLTPREVQVCRLVASGLSNASIAEAMCLSPGTVRNYVTAILAKLHVQSRTQLAVEAARLGIEPARP